MNMNLHSDIPELPDPVKRRRQRSKVFRLPKQVKDKINAMLDDGVPYADIISALGEDGTGLNEQNISTWKDGGYLDWLRQRERVESFQTKCESALDFIKADPGATLHGAARNLAAVQLSEVIDDFSVRDLLDVLHEKPELYPRILNVLARLSESDVASSRNRLLSELITVKIHQTRADAAEKSMQPAGPQTLADIAIKNKLLPDQLPS